MTNSLASRTWGGRFLVDAVRAGDIFVPECFDAEARGIAEVADRFLRTEVLPHVDRIESGDHALMHELIQKAGAIGLLGADIPKEYGGLGLPISTAALIAEKLNWQQSFALTHEAHTVIATLPLLYFGNHDQKSRYLPKLATGEWIGSFALSEANSGSDALAASTRADLSADGTQYILNGMKMWITNTGFAKLFTVFAQVYPRTSPQPSRWKGEGEGSKPQFSAFLVERDTPGLSFGQEERKLGMRGTSTRRVNLDDVAVPVENAFGIGKGQYAAFCALNMGRFKLEAGAVGGLKETLAACAKSAVQRKTFGRPIGDYGLVKHKLATLAARTFALESMVYRLAGDLDSVFDGIDPLADDASTHYHRAAEEFAIECNIVKVIGSETYSRMTDEAIQIHGGYGYTENFPVARAWRDQRLLRIGEGANEIVRLAIVNLILRRQAQDRLQLPTIDPRSFEDAYGRPSKGQDALDQTSTAVRQLAVYLISCASDDLGKDLMEAQEAVAGIADVICSAYALDSLRLRCERMQSMGHQDADVALLAAQVASRDYVDEAVTGVKTALDALDNDPIFSWRDEPLSDFVAFVEALERPWSNPARLRRELADVVIDKGGWMIE